jgi:hypothetical protein
LDRPLSVLAAGCAALALLVGTAASAQVVETSTITNTYSYRVGSQSGSNANAPGDTSLFISSSTGGFQSDLGLALTASLNDGSFSFLHNGFCVGDCTLSITTDVTFTLTNTGSAPVNLRFDSLITPGHLGRSSFGGPRAPGASFLFDVTQDNSLLYRATGINAVRPPFVETIDDTPFNGINRNSNPPSWEVLDWSATNLNVNLLTIRPGQTSTFVYSSRVDVTTIDPACLDPSLCLGYQVAFGDPRSRGDPTVETGRVGSFDSDIAPLAALFPAVGAAYDPFTVTYAFVPVGSPLPGPQAAYPPFDYDIPYNTNGAIPEPSVWALMLMGFAAVGTALRRRRGGRTPGLARA